MWHPVQQAWQALVAIPHIGTWLSVLWLGYVVALGVYIILQKREPAATLSWLFSLALLPYLGFVIYYLLGPQKIRRQRLRRPRSHQVYPGAEDSQGSADDALLHRLAKATTGFRPVTAHDVRLLVDGAAELSFSFEEPVQAGAPTRVETGSYSYLHGEPHETPLAMDMGTGMIDPSTVEVELGDGVMATELKGLGLPKAPDFGTWGTGLSATFQLGHPLG